jgi:hypothetical protein
MDVPGGIYQYDSEAQANADVEQVRAEARKMLRTATSYSVFAVDADGKTFHSTISGEKDALAFLAYAAAKSFRNLTLLLDADKARELIDAVLEQFEERE